MLRLLNTYRTAAELRTPSPPVDMRGVVVVEGGAVLDISSGARLDSRKRRETHPRT